MWSVPAVHSMPAFGYRISGSQKFAVVYNTWGTTAQQQYAEYNYNQVLGGGATIATMQASQLLPGGGSGTHNHSVLISPDGGEVVSGPTPVTWYSWGNTIKTTDLEASYDSGASWAAFATAVPTTRGWNTRMWTPAQQCRTARVRLRSLDATGALVSADGSHTDISVSLCRTGTHESEAEFGPARVLRSRSGRQTCYPCPEPWNAHRAPIPESGNVPAIRHISVTWASSNPAGRRCSIHRGYSGNVLQSDCDFKIEVDVGGTVP